MMKKLLFVFVLFFPFLVFADTYNDIAGASQMIADSFDDLWVYFFDDVPSMFQRAFNYAYEFAFKIKLYFVEMSLKASWAIAKELIESFQIMSSITSSITILPQDVRQALVDMRLFDAINLLLQAQVTRFVLRT
jgi:hypothetical protein